MKKIWLAFTFFISISVEILGKCNLYNFLSLLIPLWNKKKFYIRKCGILLHFCSRQFAVWFTWFSILIVMWNAWQMNQNESYEIWDGKEFNCCGKWVKRCLMLSHRKLYRNNFSDFISKAKHELLLRRADCEFKSIHHKKKGNFHILPNVWKHSYVKAKCTSTFTNSIDLSSLCLDSFAS